MEPLDADAIVFVAGAGSGVERARDLRLVRVDRADIRNHIFATAAKHDSVLLRPKLNGPPPSGPVFDATVFGSDTVRGPWTSPDRNPNIHSSYFDSGNRALQNIGYLVTGNGHLVT